MVSAGCFRGQKHENEIDRLIVYGLEIHRRGQTGKKPVDAGNPGDLAMRNGNALAQARRAQFFALEKGFKNAARINAQLPTGRGSQLGQELLFGACA